jgi:DNA-binding MarR family transcriptional regulator
VTSLRRGIDLADCNCMSLRRAARRVSHAYDVKLSQVGLTIAQFDILASLDQIGSASVNGLAEAIELDRSTIWRNVRVLQRNGIVQITDSEEDGRTRAISMTPKGAHMFLMAVPLWEEAQIAFEESNGRTEAAGLRNSLGQLGRTSRKEISSQES